MTQLPPGPPRCGEKTSSWGISHFLSLLLVRVSLVSKGRTFWLKGSWGEDPHAPGAHTAHATRHSDAPEAAAAAGDPVVPTAPSTAHGKATLTQGAGSPSTGTANLLFLVAQITFKQLGTVGISCVRPGHHQKSTTGGRQQHTTVGGSTYKNTRTPRHTDTETMMRFFVCFFLTAPV